MKKGKDDTLLWGLHAVNAALQNPERRHQTLWATANGVKELTIPSGLTVKDCDMATLNKMLPENAVHQGVVLKASPLKEPSLDSVLKNCSEDTKVVILDHVTDPHNVGAIIRTAAALGAQALVMTEKHSPPLSGTLAKTACGGIEVLPIIKVTNLARAMDEIKELGFWTVGLDEHAPQTITEAGLTGKLALVMGAEGEGLRRLTRENCDHMVKLPTRDDFSTLNVSVATALALYELVRGR